MSLLNLAIETSGRCNSVAIVRGETVLQKTDQKTFLDDRPEIGARGAASLLMPMIQSLFESSATSPEELDLISVVRGPGMFTGLRVGIVTAKTMAFALGKPVVAVDALEACAQEVLVQNPLPVGATIGAVVNAQRGQLFAAGFEVTAGNTLRRRGSSELVSADQWLFSLDSGQTITGTGLRIVKDKLGQLRQRDPSIHVQPPEKWPCDVVTVAAIGNAQFERGGGDDLWSLCPVYFRPSAAEEVKQAQ